MCQLVTSRANGTSVDIFTSVAGQRPPRLVHFLFHSTDIGRSQAAERDELVRVERDAVRGVRCEHAPERRPHRARVVDPAERVRLAGERGGVRVEEEDGAPVRGVFCRVLNGPPERVLRVLALADLWANGALTLAS